MSRTNKKYYRKLQDLQDLINLFSSPIGHNLVYYRNFIIKI